MVDKGGNKASPGVELCTGIQNPVGLLLVALYCWKSYLPGEISAVGFRSRGHRIGTQGVQVFTQHITLIGLPKAWLSR